MASKYDILAARWVFDSAGVQFPEGEIDSVYLDTSTGYGGHCETCSYEYSYVNAHVTLVDGTSIYASYDPGWTVELSDILEGMAKYDKEI